MASTSFPHLLLAICLSLLTVSWVSAQTVAPSNATANDSVEYVLTTILNQMSIQPQILPLTNAAGLSGNPSQQVNLQGSLVLTNPSSVQALEPGDIAYISCEPSDYTGRLDAATTISIAANNKPSAIVLYSVYAAACSFSSSGGFQYTSMYTMQSANNSAMVVEGLQKNNPAFPQSTIILDQGSVNGTSGSGSGSGGGGLGKSPTTAVAMIILYSITGIITALFLIIIIVGAIRAHRHPERYGPRRVIGRARQGRAKGLARAMLETIPIVKFGDKEEDGKPAVPGRDIELADASANAAADTEHHGDGASTSNTAAPAGSGPDVVKTEAAAGSGQHTEGDMAGTGDNTDNGLACSVCTDDFVKGQDIRVLPCRHKFHPECIDPWLLNVSGTCPLCRVDLHPTSPGTEEPEEDEAETYVTPADHGNRSNAPHEAARRNRRSRILSTLNVGRMRHATPNERIEALRRLRSENQTTNENVDQGASNVGERTTMNRARARLSRAFGSRPASGVHSSRPTSQIPATAATATAEASTTTETPATTAGGASEAPALVEATPPVNASASSPR